LKIYTKAGDKGDTGLFGGARVRKDVIRVEAYGSLDELNACVGVAVSGLRSSEHELAEVLSRIQSELFDIGAELATPPDLAGTKLASRVPRVGEAQVRSLETEIDRYEAQLAPLKTFILPGGCQAAAALHLARTVARRVERRVVTLSAHEVINPELLKYLNRLSDLLFVLARTANRLDGTADIPWAPRVAD
jgi:cob(I)alamin adenosyltransferase